MQLKDFFLLCIDFFSSAYLDVSLRQVPLLQLWIHCRIRDSSSRGFPHSDICGSKLICSSPQLFAAYRVLLRLLMPRHPSCALSSLTYLTITSSLSNFKLLWQPLTDLQNCLSVPTHFTLCFPEKPSNLICLKSFPICCFHFLNVFSLFSFQCAGRECKALSKLNNNQVNWSPCLTRITSGPQSGVGLLRKEVIQPLVLERLPCYDFTPIITPTLGHALH